MSLIKCPECGKDVSDRATHCIHCGFPLENRKGKKITCPECGSIIKEESIKCPNCGCPSFRFVLSDGVPDIRSNDTQYMNAHNNIMPDSFAVKYQRIFKKVFISLSILFIIVLIGYFLTIFYTKEPVKSYMSSVVCVRSIYHYELTLDDYGASALPKPVILKYPETSTQAPYFTHQASAFFIDEKGCLATNRSIALPWNYYKIKDVKSLEYNFKRYLSSELQINIDDDFTDESLVNAIMDLRNTELGKKLLNDCNSASELQNRLIRIKNAKVKIKGVLDDITIEMPGHKQVHNGEFKHCNVLIESGSSLIDLAILQLTDKKTPDGVKVVPMDYDICDTKVENTKSYLYVLGFPYYQQEKDGNTKVLKSALNEIKCISKFNKYTFDFDSENINISGGSPIFSRKGKIIGLTCSNLEEKNIKKAVYIKYLRNLYLSDNATDSNIKSHKKQSTSSHNSTQKKMTDRQKRIQQLTAQYNRCCEDIYEHTSYMDKNFKGGNIMRDGLVQQSYDLICAELPRFRRITNELLDLLKKEGLQEEANNYETSYNKIMAAVSTMESYYGVVTPPISNNCSMGLFE